MNSEHPDLKLGENLATFKEFSKQFDPAVSMFWNIEHKILKLEYLIVRNYLPNCVEGDQHPHLVAPPSNPALPDFFMSLAYK